MIRALRHRYSGLVLVILLLTACGLAGAAFAQDTTIQARIDYETAKLALEQGKPKVALEKLRAVRAVLGDLPELLVFTAQAYFDTGNSEEAKKLLGQALASKDVEFQKSRAFETAIKLSAKTQLDSATEGKSFEDLGLGNWAEHRDRRRAQMGECFHEYNGLEVGAKWRERITRTSSNVAIETSVGPGGLETIVVDGQSSSMPCSPETIRPKELRTGVSWTYTLSQFEYKGFVAGTEKVTFLGRTVEALLVLTQSHGRDFRGTDVSCSIKDWVVRGVGSVRGETSCTNGSTSFREMLDYSVPK